MRAGLEEAGVQTCECLKVLFLALAVVKPGDKPKFLLGGGEYEWVHDC